LRFCARSLTNVEDRDSKNREKEKKEKVGKESGIHKEKL
jgi:hypothetical protein